MLTPKASWVLWLLSLLPVQDKAPHECSYSICRGMKDKWCKDKHCYFHCLILCAMFDTSKTCVSKQAARNYVAQPRHSMRIDTEMGKVLPFKRPDEQGA